MLPPAFGRFFFVAKRAKTRDNMPMRNIIRFAKFAALAAVCPAALALEDYKKPVAEDADFFPPFDSIKPPLLMPRDAKLEFSKEGHFLVDGEPRYMEGTIFYEGDSMSFGVPTYGYPPSLKWLYETTQNYEDLQRLGFDTVGTGLPNDWMRKYRKRFIHLRANDEMFLRYAKSGLPLYVDFTAAEWSHGGLKYAEGMPPAKEAFTVPGRSYHWMPYSANAPEGRQLWREMWEGGAEFLKKRGIKPFMYELFNEPDYDDLSEYNRKLFAKKMKSKYGGKISRLNAEWGASYSNFDEISGFKNYDENAGLFVEWVKFMEDSFAGLCKFGAKVIRDADGRPDVGVCFQPIFLDGNNVNIYKADRHLDAVCSSTGGGDFFQARFMRAIADGKPIFDGETYMGHTRESFRNKILEQYMRGYNASYLFKWSRRPNDPAWKLENGGVRLAEKFPYMVLNPYAVHPRAFLGLMDAKRAIFSVNGLFTPRDRGVKSDVAVLYSYPTNRLQRYPKAPPLQTDMEKKVSAALEYSQVQYDIVLEEQLKSGRQNRYKVLVCAGAASYKSTPRKLLEYAEGGGTLVLFFDALTLDEYGKPLGETIAGIGFGADRSAVSGELKIGGESMKAFHFKSVKMPEGWTPIGEIGGEPAVWEKPAGKGKMVFVNAKVSGADLRRLAFEILRRSGAEKLCGVENAITGAPCGAVEMAKARAGGKVGYFLFNRSLDAEAVALAPKEGLVFAEILSGKIIERDAEGRIILPLKSGEPAVIVGAPEGEVARVFGGFKRVSGAGAARAAAEWDRKLREEKMDSAKAFDVPAANLRTIPMREFANLDCSADIPLGGSFGKLKSLPWGVENCNGIPFDFIRPDHNKNLTAIGLGDFSGKGKFSEVRGVKIDSKASALYFLHAAAGDAEGEIARYAVNYSDGTKAEIPIVMNRNVGAWDAVLNPDKNAETVAGFINPDNRGLYVWKWENPFPHKLIKSVDAVLTRPSAAYFAAGITAESPSGDSDCDAVKLAGEGASARFINCESGKFENGVAEMSAAKMKNYARVIVDFGKKFSLPESAAEGSLSFDIDVGAGNSAPELYAALDRTVDNISRSTRGMLEDLGDGRYRARIPLSALLKGERDSFGRAIVQINGAPKGFEKIKIGNFELVAYRSANPFRNDAFETSQWGGIKMSKGRGYVSFGLDNDSKKWCVGTLKFLRPVPVPEGFGKKSLVFEINAGPDVLGNRNIGSQNFQMNFSYLDANGKKASTENIVVSKGGFISGGAVDGIPATWQKVSIPVARIMPKGADGVSAITSIALQYMLLPADRAGVQIRNIRFE